MGSEKPLRTIGPRGSKRNRLPTHSSRTATDTEMPRGFDARAETSRELYCGPEEVVVVAHGLSCADPDANFQSCIGAFVSRRQVSLHRDRSFDCTRHRRERGHDAVAGVLHLSPVVQGQRLTHDPVVLVEQRDRPVVTESFGHLRRTTDVGEQHGTDRRCRVRLSDGMLGQRTEERLDRPWLDLDDVAGELAVRLAMNLLDRLDARPFGQTEHRPGFWLEPVGQKPNPVTRLDADILGVCCRDLLGRCARYVVSIHVQGHADDRKTALVLNPDKRDHRHGSSGQWCDDVYGRRPHAEVSFIAMARPAGAQNRRSVRR